jgi:hypothetical protein
MRGWFKAFTAAGVLAVAGFVAKFAHEQLLGISLSDWSVLNLGLFAGRWIMDTLDTVLSTIPKFPWYIEVLLLLLFVPLTGLVFLPVQHRLMPWLRASAMMAVCVALLPGLLRFEIPTISMSGWAQWDPQTLMASNSTAGWLGRRGEVIRGTFLLSKLDGVDSKRSQSALLMTALKGAGQSGLLNQYPSAGKAQETILRWYTGCFLTCLFGCLACGLFRNGPMLTRLDQIAEFLYYIAIYALIPVSAILLPYMYGKVICSTDYPTANINYTPRDGTGPQKLLGCPLLETSDGNLRVLRVVNRVPIILVIETGRLNSEPAIQGETDVVTYVLEQQLGLDPNT